MCNTCNTDYTNAYSSHCSCHGYARQNRGCGCNFCACCPFSWLFGNNTANTASTQSVCRDCNGCLRIINRSGGCGCSCHHSCGCGYANANGTATTNNGNGSANGFYGCYTVCGRIGNGLAVTTANDDNDGYYARQYGLTRRCSSYSSCNCGCN